MLNSIDCLPTAKCSSLGSGPVGYLQSVGLPGSFRATLSLSNCNELGPHERQIGNPWDSLNLTLARVRGRHAGFGLNRGVALSYLMCAARLPGLL